ncbi:hypothetical protein HD597_012946 [Nonomuraea thailandensis]|uniref:Tetratricopeptide repeat protein n=1 Tax=Nonomuraea thailandensis TaxID=1188745 RepID=A0A9X2K9J6_9ACTN|nr:hypothetical protein [Nonomuraea thailandensis]MCP2365842.1 hypothetical protein [Nonomuraea thailandensis]
MRAWADGRLSAPALTSAMLGSWSRSPRLAALLPIRERVLGADHPDTLTTRHNLAYWTGEAEGMEPDSG